MPVTEDQALAEASVQRLHDADAVAHDLGIELLAVGPGTATTRMRVVPTMANGHGLTHGGYVFLLADTAFAYACNSGGRDTVASGGDIEFLEPSRPGDELVAEAQERVLRGRGGLYDVRVTSGGRVVAELRGRSRALRREGGA
ncbi:hydroxyphenylacetyl-CoA thioesterase PaaI [Vallicoccus soli]|uniref:hydroxyphenylacetyl-CoA thioesterase PaaI n=1 Tax=Vallicoccus soli TaxID=2339232 RepID=UPI001C49ACFB|nr:hydroxyphenylacetyl-CoA thioesterase PaaI [Vallicoccus soli]